MHLDGDRAAAGGPSVRHCGATTISSRIRSPSRPGRMQVTLTFLVGCCAGWLLARPTRRARQLPGAPRRRHRRCGTLRRRVGDAVGPVHAAGASDLLALTVSLAYPLFDVAVFTVAAVVLVRSGSRERLPLAMFTAGLALIALSDTPFAYLAAHGAYDSGRLIAVGWVAGMLLIAVGAVASRPPRRVNPVMLELPVARPSGCPTSRCCWPASPRPPIPVSCCSIRSSSGSRLCWWWACSRGSSSLSENRRLVAAVAEQGLRDPLTGLANRARSTERLNVAMEQREREGVSVGAISLDLDDFKLVNDDRARSCRRRTR